jgi:translation initiation factor 1 (eIF-1/SUI1)
VKDIDIVVDRKNRENPIINIKMSKKRYQKIVDFIEELTEDELEEAMKTIDNYERRK